MTPLSNRTKLAAGAAVAVAVPAALGAAKKLGGAGMVRKEFGGRMRTKEELYDEAKRLGIEGRSSMTKAQLERAISRARS
jgi:hypothetical protein